ncbi:MAG: hypothetical protein ACREJ3_05760, partial [Polyangiaceae bacterium]
AVVFLHASLEDLLRSVLAWKLPSTADFGHLDDVPLDGEKLRKYTLGDIAKHRGKSVEDLIDHSVAAYLERSNFNNVSEIASALARSGVASAALRPYGSDLESIMKRRHLIVHRADHNPDQGPGHFAARSLHPNTVKAWATSVEAFGRAVLALL